MCVRKLLLLGSMRSVSTIFGHFTNKKLSQFFRKVFVPCKHHQAYNPPPVANKGERILWIRVLLIKRRRILRHFGQSPSSPMTFRSVMVLSQNWTIKDLSAQKFGVCSRYFTVYAEHQRAHARNRTELIFASDTRIWPSFTTPLVWIFPELFIWGSLQYIDRTYMILCMRLCPPSIKNQEAASIFYPWTSVTRKMKWIPDIYFTFYHAYTCTVGPIAHIFS